MAISRLSKLSGYLTQGHSGLFAQFNGTLDHPGGGLGDPLAFADTKRFYFHT